MSATNFSNASWRLRTILPLGSSHAWALSSLKELKRLIVLIWNGVKRSFQKYDIEERCCVRLDASQLASRDPFYASVRPAITCLWLIDDFGPLGSLTGRLPPVHESVDALGVAHQPHQVVLLEGREALWVHQPLIAAFDACDKGHGLFAKL